jgi:hypothetical protein
MHRAVMGQGLGLAAAHPPATTPAPAGGAAARPPPAPQTNSRIARGGTTAAKPAPHAHPAPVSSPMEVDVAPPLSHQVTSAALHVRLEPRQEVSRQRRHQASATQDNTLHELTGDLLSLPVSPVGRRWCSLVAGGGSAGRPQRLLQPIGRRANAHDHRQSPHATSTRQRIAHMLMSLWRAVVRL